MRARLSARVFGRHRAARSRLPNAFRDRFRSWRLAAGAGALMLLAGNAAGAGGDSTPTNTAFAAHLAQLADKVPGGFTVVVQPPFVVIGDESPDMVRQRATRTVKWAVDKLKQDYFQRDPAGVIDIWLFRDRESYTNHARRMFADTPTSPFGYYSAQHHALIMNIGTGGGTLVHEIVHPFMAANFPGCPAWFNEGLASLYEAAAEQDGHIRGLINWRLKGLEQAIRDGETIPFERLTALTSAGFYGDGDNYNQHYAQARYLCYYLQEEGLLVKFYREFAANAKRDPTGCATLKRVLGTDDLPAFQKKWETFVLGLRSPDENRR
jgi:hypothetical protein